VNLGESTIIPQLAETTDIHHASKSKESTLIQKDDRSSKGSMDCDEE